MKRLGDRIASARTAMGLTQIAFAEKVGIGQSFLSGIEKGTKKPSVDTLIAIWDLIVPGEDIFEEREKTLTVPRELLTVWDTSRLGTPPAKDMFLPVPIVNPKDMVLVAGKCKVNYRKHEQDFAMLHREALKVDDADNLVCMFVDGDSMEPILLHGSIVCIDMSIKPNTDSSSELVWAIKINTEESVIKHLLFHENKMFFLSENHRKYPAVKAPHKAEIIGRVIGVWNSL